jgi:hypothetical protein
MSTYQGREKSPEQKAAEILNEMKRSPHSDMMRTSPMSAKPSIAKEPKKFLITFKNYQSTKRKIIEDSDEDDDDLPSIFNEPFIPDNSYIELQHVRTPHFAANNVEVANSYSNNTSGNSYTMESIVPPVVTTKPSREVYKTLDWFDTNVWNRSFQTIMIAMNNDTALLEIVRSALDTICTSWNGLPTGNNKSFYDFLVAGETHRDFVQLSISCNLSKHSVKHRHLKSLTERGYTCGLCNHEEPLFLIKMQVLEDNAPFNNVVNTGCYACFECYNKLIAIIELFHFIWYVSRPFAGLKNQGYSTTKLPSYHFAFGSKKKDKIKQAHDVFNTLVEKIKNIKKQ